MMHGQKMERLDEAAAWEGRNAGPDCILLASGKGEPGFCQASSHSNHQTLIVAMFFIARDSRDDGLNIKI